MEYKAVVEASYRVFACGEAFLHFVPKIVPKIMMKGKHTVEDPLIYPSLNRPSMILLISNPAADCINQVVKAE